MNEKIKFTLICTKYYYDGDGLLTVTADRGVRSRTLPASTTLAQTVRILTVKFLYGFTAKKNEKIKINNNK